jgi:hypothetical protein
MNADLWGPIQLPDGGERTYSLGETEARVVRKGEAYRVSLNGNARAVQELPRWRTVQCSRGAELLMVPATPDLPVVIRPDEQIALAMGSEAEFRIRIPAWIKLLVRSENQGEESVVDVPCRDLKRTWFGTGEAGELGYSLSFTPESSAPTPRDMFTVPVRIVNASQSVLLFERFLLRVIHLDLYQTASGLATNGVTVQFKGREQLSQIMFEPRTSAARRYNGTHVGTSRVPVERDVIKKSFLWLKDLAS